MSKYLIDLEAHIMSKPIRASRFGRVASVVGLIIEVTGLRSTLGEIYNIHVGSSEIVQAEVVGVKADKTLMMPLDHMEGIGIGALVEPLLQPMEITVGWDLLGRVVDSHVNPIDGKGPLVDLDLYPLHNEPPGPLERENINEPLRTGIRSVDGFLTVGNGQRMGIFAGSGVGKSTMMGMIARHSSADINVIGLIGERGREVREFIEDSLGPEGLARSVVVAVTSDKAAMSRVRGAFTATAIAEYFRDQGKNVLLMMDSVTRVAMAQREIGLASGEPPTTKGYTPSVFAMLPKLLERAGRTSYGSITGLYTVLVDNDDMNEPIADAVRSIIDGHIVLSRKLAHKNHYPAVDVLESVSRVMPKVVTKEQRLISQQAREILATYRDASELINIGAYAKGSNPSIDNAIEKIDDLDKFLKQDLEASDFDADIWQRLTEIVQGKKNTAS
ncbi:MAG TPA: FliI/YscN family ATPase [Balneolales bacterium]|nr:FliI/YscN family ATPase [Balneolales bacterium]